MPGAAAHADTTVRTAVTAVAAVAMAVETAAAVTVVGTLQVVRQFAAQGSPLSVKWYGARFRPRQVARKPKDSVPSAVTVLL